MVRVLHPGKILAFTVLCSLILSLAPATDGSAGSPERVAGDDARTCLVAGRPVSDFKLKDIVSGRMVTFLDIWKRDYTFIVYLGKPSPRCLENVRTLERLRNRFRDRVTLVAVFLDPENEDDLLRFLISSQVYPDYALHDPDFHQVRCYGLTRTPTLIVTGPDGNILLRATCSGPVDTAAFCSRLERVLALNGSPSGMCPEARRIYAEAMEWAQQGRPEMAALYLERVLELRPNLYTVNRLLADIYRELGRPREAARYYSRYLGADMYAYDLQEVRERIRSLAVAGR